MHDSRAIANIFVQKAKDAGDQLTIMSLLKYVYFAHGWTLGNGLRALIDNSALNPLANGRVEAWKYGPVIPAVYHAFRPQGAIIREEAFNPKTGKPYSVTTPLTDDENIIISGVYEEYRKTDPFVLSSATHRAGTPWSKHKDKFFCHIPDRDIAEYYRMRVAQIEDDAEPS